MTWRDLFAGIKAGALDGVYLFSGQEEFIKREALDALQAKLLPPGMEQLNLSVLEGAGAREVIAAAETLPFLCERRLVVLRDWAPLLPGKAKNEEAEVARMLTWLENPPPTAIVVFYMRSEPDARKRLPAALKKRGAEVRFDPLSDQELLRWANKRLKPVGKSMSQEAASHLAFSAGRELNRLSQELDKLAAFVGDRAEIDVADIEEAVSPSLEFSVFEMLDFLFAGDAVRAERSLGLLVTGGQTYVGILAMVIRQLRTLTHMALSIRAGAGTAAVEKQLGLHPYAARRAAEQVRGLDPARLKALYGDCVDADFAIKSGKLRDREALRLAMLKIAEIRRAEPGTNFVM